MKPLPVLLGFLACATTATRGQNQAPPISGPYTHSVCSASSSDGLHWTRDEGVRLEHASVPCATVKDGKVYLYFVDANRDPGEWESTALAVSADGLNFERHAIEIEGMTSDKALDPCAIIDEDGKVWLYYFAASRDFDLDPTHRVERANSADGIHFKNQGLAFESSGLVDPDVFYHDGKWFMYVFGRGATIVATSPNGAGFRYLQDLEPRNWGTTKPVRLAKDDLRLYAFEQRVQTGNRVCSFRSSDGLHWEQEEGTRLQAGENEQITDPYVIRWKDGWKMYFKSGPPPRRPAAFRPQNNPDRGGPQKGRMRPEQQDGNAPARQGRAGQAGPWNNDVIIYRASADGSAQRVGSFPRAGVPTLARLADGRLIAAHQHFPENEPESFDKVAVHFSEDDGATWSDPQVIEVSGMPEGMRFPFDPTLVTLPDGRVRLYFTGMIGRRFEEYVPRIHSAISADGIHYKYEEGARFGVDEEPVIDCAVALLDGRFHLYSPVQPDSQRRAGGNAAREEGYHAVSDDGLKFERLENVALDGGGKWLGNAYAAQSVIRFAGTGSGPGGNGGGVWLGESVDGSTWKVTTRLRVTGADPGIQPAKDGGWVVLVTGPPRE